MGHPDIAFKYVNNNTTILHTSGNHDKKTAVLYVYGKQTATKMLEVNYKKGEYNITGLVRKIQNFLVQIVLMKIYLSMVDILKIKSFLLL